MSDPLQFPCPHCDQVNRVPRAYAGKTGKCPACNKAIKVPDPDAPEPAEPEPVPEEPVDDSKECIFCGERIKKVARKCRHCGEFVDGSAPPRQDPLSRAGDYEPCPFCQGKEAEKVSFTWWGGLIGPGMLTHVRCLDCERCFNGKTGKSNDRAIAIYVGVGIVLCVGLCIFFGVIIAMQS